jgi:hypothetical protein
MPRRRNFSARATHASLGIEARVSANGSCDHALARSCFLLARSCSELRIPAQFCRIPAERFLRRHTPS